MCSGFYLGCAASYAGLMENTDKMDVFLTAFPGLEDMLCAEAQETGFADATAVPGGVEMTGTWPDIWRANLELRGATRVLVRLGAFPVFHLAQLDKRSRKFPWAKTLRSDVPVRVEVTCRRSKIYHAGAATQRIETALREELKVEVAKDAALCVKVRIEDNFCTISLDTSGESLHKRGHKEAVGKAPMRETLAALFLRSCGYTGQEPVLDPMCGSGTFPIEAAEIATGMQAGRSRNFAFESFASFDASTFADLRRMGPRTEPNARFFGSDRDTGAIRMATANAERAGVSERTNFHNCAVGDVERPDGPPGLVIINPPYGARIGNKKLLYALHGSMGKVFAERFSGWRVGIVTTEGGLARATGLPFLPPGPPVPHGGLKVRLYQTKPLP